MYKNALAKIIIFNKLVTKSYRRKVIIGSEVVNAIMTFAVSYDRLATTALAAALYNLINRCSTQLHRQVAGA